MKRNYFIYQKEKDFFFLYNKTRLLIYTKNKYIYIFKLNKDKYEKNF